MMGCDFLPAKVHEKIKGVLWKTYQEGALKQFNASNDKSRSLYSAVCLDFGANLYSK